MVTGVGDCVTGLGWRTVCLAVGIVLIGSIYSSTRDFLLDICKLDLLFLELLRLSYGFDPGCPLALSNFSTVCRLHLLGSLTVLQLLLAFLVSFLTALVNHRARLVLAINC